MKKLLLLLLLPTLSLSVFPQERDKNTGSYVVVLDIQKHFINSCLTEKAADNFINTINEITKNTPPEKVIYMESIVAQLALTLSGPAVEFADGLGLDERLDVVSRNIFIKNKSNSFSSEKFTEFVQSKNIKEFIVVGLAADHCVLSTVMGGKKLGYIMSVIPEAIVGTTPEAKEEAMEKMQAAGIVMLNIDDIK